MRKAIIIFLLVAASAVSQSQTAAQPSKSPQAKPSTPPAKPAPAAALPTHAMIDAAMQRTFGYDPGITWNILDVRASAIPGLADVMVSINKQAVQHLYLAPETQLAIAGQILPFGENPFAPAREKLHAADGPTLGSKTPAIEIVEFSDLQCPHCKSAAPILEKLAADFPQVRITFQQFPLTGIHPWAMRAAKYADCAAKANPEAFWKYIDSVFENQGGIAQVTADDKLQQLATAAGLDAAKVSACAASPEAEARVNKSLQLGEALDVNETPTVFVNGRRVLGLAAIPYDQLKTLVQFEIDHAGK